MSKIACVISLSMMLLIAAQWMPAYSAGKKPVPKKPPAKGKHPPVNMEPVSYLKEVKPILDKYCIGCHNPDLKKGGLLMETYEQMMKGGDSGQIIVTGKSAESLVYKSLIGKDTLKMPPMGNIGPAEKEINLIKRWIDEGAKNDGAPVPAPGADAKPEAK